MDPQRWARIESLYHAALEEEPSRRPAFLTGECGDQTELRREVESLLGCADGELWSPLHYRERWPSRFRLGSYEIIEALGAGGMGEVYRAKDTKLKREVAVKVLPLEFQHDPSRLARFEREAQVLASLNDPHITAIYGVEEAEGLRFLVLELVEGPTLAERIASGPIEVAGALAIAKQIAEALEAVHQEGIIHRDLKPANVKLAPGGKVKVLDFGLAAVVCSSTKPNQKAGHINLTQPGTLLGTAAYMSPEQARSLPLDRRSDIWSMGAVMYEMLSGRKAFDGETVPHALVKVMEQQPDWSKLPPGLPTNVRRILKQCLEKDLEKRLPDIRDLRLQLQYALAKPIRNGRGRRASPPIAVAGDSDIGLNRGHSTYSAPPDAAGTWDRRDSGLLPERREASEARYRLDSRMVYRAGQSAYFEGEVGAEMIRTLTWSSPQMCMSEAGTLRRLRQAPERVAGGGGLWKRVDEKPGPVVPKTVR
jgi:serine/threonine-protein kinase